MSDFSEAIEQAKADISLQEWCRSNLTPKGNKFVCPVCNSGGHDVPSSDSAFSIRGTRWHCFSCGSGGDILDLAGIVHGTEDKREQLRLVSEWAGIDSNQRAGRVPAEAPAPRHRPASTYEAGRRAQRAYIAESRKRIEHPDAIAYLQKRGISLDDARAWGLGYDENRRRLIIPWEGTDYYHVDRDITGEHQHKYEKPRADAVGAQPVWNEAALGSVPFFVVEGALDALAVHACGYEAVALGGTGGRSLIEAVSRSTGGGHAVLLLDSDKVGREAQERIAAEMSAAGIAYTEADIGELSVKDAGEAYASCRARLEEFLSSWASRARSYAEEAKESAYASTLTRLRVVDPSSVAGDLFMLVHERKDIPTGLRAVDEALGGGLPSRGLVALGAVSSVGKTTFAVQVADHVALEGRTVLFVTVEQSAEEIVAKSLSRLTSMTMRENGTPIKVSAKAITNAAERRKWATEDREKAQAFQIACECYDGIVHRPDGKQTLHIMEAASQPTVADVRIAAEEIARHNGEPPVVFIDYLQLLAPEVGHERDSDKQITDRNVMALRQMARDMETCVFAISSLNRSSYAGSVSLESFKESGAIEYGTDLLLGLQPANMERDLENETEQASKAKAKVAMRDFKANERRECELVILKNRNGGLPRYGVKLTYDALINTFLEYGG